jgi:hypothetical protein
VLILRTASQKSNYVIYYDIKVLKAEIWLTRNQFEISLWITKWQLVVEKL